MTAFSGECYREIHVHLEKGDIYGDMLGNVLTCNIYGEGQYKIDVNLESDSAYGHGGGDVGMINTIIDFYAGKDKMRTTINQSMQSHYIGFSAELSRKNGGNVVEIE